VLPQYTKSTPRQSKGQFLGHFCWAEKIWRWEWFFLVVLDRLLRTTTKKIVNFFLEKMHPDKILATPMYNIKAYQAKQKTKKSVHLYPLSSL